MEGAVAVVVNIFVVVGTVLLGVDVVEFLAAAEEEVVVVEEEETAEEAAGFVNVCVVDENEDEAAERVIPHEPPCSVRETVEVVKLFSVVRRCAGDGSAMLSNSRRKLEKEYGDALKEFNVGLATVKYLPRDCGWRGDCAEPEREECALALGLLPDGARDCIKGGGGGNCFFCIVFG